MDNREKRIQKTKIDKRMRELVRKNKKVRHKSIKRKKNDILPSDVYDFLQEVHFDDIPIKDRIAGKTKNGIVAIQIPEIFSITKNPEETIGILKKIYHYCGKDNIKRIVFDHRKCRELEIAASTIMDTIVMAGKMYRRNIGNELSVSGNFPIEPKCRKMFIASGLPAHLQLERDIVMRKDNVKLFALVAGKSGTVRSGTVSTHLTDYFDECLRTQDFKLSGKGRNIVSKMFGEVIENCEIHGGERSSWYVLGHFDLVDHNYGEVNLVIFNYGKTIYEQLIGHGTTKETKEKIEYMRKVHESQYDDTWTEEAMLTVFSLQKGISRLRDQQSEGNKKRGTGTFRMLEIFYTLGKSNTDLKPEFSITSGNTHILFDNRYRLADTTYGSEVLEIEKIKVIAFNENNNILEKADARNVTIMKKSFPGTIISMKFYIDRKYLETL